MFTNSSVMRACIRHRDLFRDLQRHISKTSSTPNSNAFTNRKNNNSPKSQATKWSRLNRHNNQRALSTLQAKIAPQAAAVTVASKEESREFMAIFPDIVRDLTEAGKHTDIPEVTKWYTKVLQNNVPNGKKNRGLAVVAAYKMLEDPSNLTPENIRLANILGWCVEMFQSSLVIAEDVNDSSEKRNVYINSWQKNDDEASVKAMNDSILVENGLYAILKKHFSGLPSYVPALELFHDATLKAAMGQTLDFFAKKEGKPDLNAFTMSRYNAIVKYRTSYYSFYLPVALAMFLSSRFEPEMHRQARTILMEMGHFYQVQIQAHFLIIDDIMDGSETRRGLPCWYKRDNVGLSAINDSLLIENGIYVLLKNYFSHLPLYVPALETMREITMKTCMGQALDSMSIVDGKPNLDAFTMKRYNDIVQYKTAYYTFHLPVALGMFLANKFDHEMHRQAKTILLELGQFFQIQDDFLDCFGNPSVTGKIGTDIQEGKCTWLVVVALQRATLAQKEIIRKYYGVNEPNAINTVKSLYEELGLPNTYAIYEEETFNLIKTHIQQISKGLPHALFFKFLDKLYRRES